MKILVISWPKAGTHALVDVCSSLFPNIESPQDDLKYPEGVDQLLFNLARLENLHPNGLLLKGHIGYDPRIENYLKKRKFKVLFLTRDPRDVICSTFSWLKELRKDWDVSRYLRLFDDATAMTMVIRGLPRLHPFELDYAINWSRPLPERYFQITQWQNSEISLHVKFEDIARNCNSESKSNTLSRIANYLGTETNGLTRSPENSQTFYKGLSGRWKSEFLPDHLEQFNQLGGAELVNQLGYESSQSIDLKRISAPESKASEEKRLSIENETLTKKKTNSTLRQYAGRLVRRFFERILDIEKLRGIDSRVATIEKSLNDFSHETDRWLYENRRHRMDALNPMFAADRRHFHLARYDFAAHYCYQKKVADIACGTGYGSHLLAVLGSASEVVGVDLDSETIAYAKKTYGTETLAFLQGDATNTNLAPVSFDVITSFETIEHVPIDEDLLEEFSNLLKTGGRLIVSTPNDWPLETAEHHVRSYSHESFLEILNRFFVVEKCLNQVSESPHMRGRKPGISETTKQNKHLAECFIAVCRKD